MTTPEPRSVRGAGVNGRGQDDLLADLERAIPLEAGLAQIVGSSAANLSPADGSTPSPAHATRLLVDLTAVIQPHTGLAAILQAEGEATAVVDDLATQIDTDRGLALIVDNPNTDSPRASTADDLATIYLSPANHRLHLRVGPASRAARLALRHLEEIRTTLGTIAVGPHPLISILDEFPTAIQRQRARTADATTAMAQALRPPRPPEDDHRNNQVVVGSHNNEVVVGSHNVVIKVYRSPLPKFTTDESTVWPIQTKTDADSNPMLGVSTSGLQAKTQDEAERKRQDEVERLTAQALYGDNAALRKLVRLHDEQAKQRDMAQKRAVEAVIGDSATAVELIRAITDRLDQMPPDERARAIAEIGRLLVQTSPQSQDQPAVQDAAPFLDHDLGDVQGLVDGVPVTESTELTQQWLAQGAGARTAALPQFPDEAAATRAASLLWETAEELAALHDELITRRAATASERLLRGCGHLVNELAQMINHVWAALSDFRGADLRAANDVSVANLDGVRWSDDNASTQPTQWPDELIDDVERHSTRVDGLPGVWEIGFGAAVSPGRR